ncbi:MAG: hypothetical protein COA79_02750 [Planctomycetota bacterium]|nr:MAG: hypothetical protein COA79_02750 [Planctomycetota bacterium]
MLMPSSFQPCGLPQMISPLNGNLPIVFDTGGLHDTITHLDINRNQGNGFVFEHHNRNGLKWAIDQAMTFFKLNDKSRSTQISRIMKESKSTFNHKGNDWSYH